MWLSNDIIELTREAPISNFNIIELYLVTKCKVIYISW